MSLFPFLPTFIQPYPSQWKYVADEVENPEAKNEEEGERIKYLD